MSSLPVIIYHLNNLGVGLSGPQSGSLVSFLNLVGCVNFLYLVSFLSLTRKDYFNPEDIAHHSFLIYSRYCTKIAYTE